MFLLMFRPDALWVLSPEIVMRISSPQEKQNYGTISGMCVYVIYVCMYVCMYECTYMCMESICTVSAQD